jgi:hypothetical protein
MDFSNLTYVANVLAACPPALSLPGNLTDLRHLT